MRALVAFDKFKDALSAPEACRLAAEALATAKPGIEIVQTPLTDGGEGFTEILTLLAGGRLETLAVHGPRFVKVDAQLGWVELAALPSAARKLLALPAAGRLAIVEMAQASGLEQLAADERDPWQTSSYGTGELMAAAMRAGADAILLGIGGSATIDLGLGALEALGLTAYEHDLQPVRKITPAKWKDIASLGGFVNAEDTIPPIRIACDVSNPLLGERGAAAVYGPQKGLAEADLARFERGLRKQAIRLLGLAGHAAATFEERLAEAGTGAAGGISFGLRTCLPGVSLVPGFALVEAWLDLRTRVGEADLVLTGEGCFDPSSLEGKGPGAVVEAAVAAGKKVHLLAGAVEASAAQQLPPGVTATALTAPGTELAEALARTGPNLQQAVTRLLA